MSLWLNWSGYIILIAAQLYVLVLFLRLIFDWISILMPTLEIKAPLTKIVSLVYALTNPPLEYLRSYLPTLKLGHLSFDMGFIILLILLLVLQRIANLLIYV